MPRPTWDEYFTEITKKVAERSTCDRGHAACVIVKENRILATGYAGSPKGCVVVFILSLLLFPPPKYAVKSGRVVDDTVPVTDPVEVYREVGKGVVGSV